GPRGELIESSVKRRSARSVFSVLEGETATGNSRMNNDMSGRRGVLVYAAVAIVGVTAVSALLYVMNLSAGDRRAGTLVMAIMATMSIPTLARSIASRTVDRDWSPPFPLRRWGRPRIAVMLAPLSTVSAIYLVAYKLAWSMGVATETPAWHGASVAINIAINL